MERQALLMSSCWPRSEEISWNAASILLFAYVSSTAFSALTAHLRLCLFLCVDPEISRRIFVPPNGCLNN
ncbi:hypothetical protein C7R93_12445 [Brevibacillus fortis]|uniref:Uncharacterized protein n=1 Tax=Brevibacillus fortis TaxID=2126352 RepID=A0A2P7V8J7_9BACL|nr:hypothetical protein C7R93_12445 [Brevibacillus fortis]